MATFEAQVEGITSLSIDGSSAPTQTELTQFLTDGAKEILNTLPKSKKSLYTTSNELNSSSTNLTIGGSEIFTVTRDDGTINQPCRLIPPNMSGRASDSDDMNAASTTDPVYYITNNILSVIPEPSNSNNAHVQTLAYPSVAYGDSSITKFPDEAEYLVPIYASIKSLQNVLGNRVSNSDITTALTAINTELDETLSIADNMHTEIGIINSSSDSALTEIALANTEVDKMATEAGLDNAELDKATAELAEAVTLVDSGIDTATAAIATAAGRINTAVALANDEFDEVAAEVSSTTTSPITQARAAVPSAISLDDLNITAVAPNAPSLSTVSYTEATNENAYSKIIDSVTVTEVSKADISGDIPTYIKPTLTTRVSFKAFYADTSNANPFGDNDPDDFSISVNTPIAPAINSISYTDATNADASASAITTAIMSSSPISYGSGGDADAILDVSSNAPTFTKPSVALDFAKVNTHLDDNEDVELAQIKISQLQAQIAEYNANISNEQNEFNKENVRYQMEFKEATEKANRDLQVAINNLNSVTQELKQESQQTTDIDKFNKAQDQALELANKAKGMEKLIADNNNQLQKYSNELQSYQAEVNKEIQEYTRKLDKYKTEMNQIFQAWSKSEADSLQQYSLDMTNELNEYNKENARYQANIQAELAKHNSDLQKVLNQARIDADDAKQEAAQTTDVDKFNKQQDQVLALQNKAKTMDAIMSNNDDLVAKFNAELNKYSTDINKEVQQYQNNIQQKVQEVESSIKIQSSYYQEAQARVNVGNAYLAEANASATEAQTYIGEISARVQQVQAQIAVAQGYIANGAGYSRVAATYGQTAQGYLGTANAYLQSAQGYVASAQAYASEIQSKIAISQGYINETQARLAVDTSYYTWYEKQQAKLQADYDKGLQLLIGQGG